jgi:integrase/recombinase XerC
MHSGDVIEDLVGWSLLVHGKGGKRRIVPCVPGLAMEIAAAAGYAFPGAIDGHLSPRRVGELVNDRLAGAWTIHSLRHRAGTRWYAIDRDVFTVQELLGHASPATTRRYVEVPREALRRTVYDALQC